MKKVIVGVVIGMTLMCLGLVAIGSIGEVIPTPVARSTARPPTARPPTARPPATAKPQVQTGGVAAKIASFKQAGYVFNIESDPDGAPAYYWWGNNDSIMATIPTDKIDPLVVVIDLNKPGDGTYEGEQMALILMAYGVPPNIGVQISEDISDMVNTGASDRTKTPSGWLYLLNVDLDAGLFTIAIGPN